MLTKPTPPTGYYPFYNEEHESYGSFEVFQETHNDHGLGLEPGFYWWSCFPGCLPDGEPSGPFDTAQEAYDDAQSNA